MAARQNVVKIFSCFTEGMTGVISEIEISLTPGLPTFDIIGLCDSSIRESRGRIRAALISSGFYMPKGHITVGISPAYMHKSGSSFDLPISLGILFVSNQLTLPTGKSIYAEGELSLKGELKATPGASVRLKTHNNEFDYSFIPKDEVNSAKCFGFNGVLANSLFEVAQNFLLNDYRENTYVLDSAVSDSEEQLDLSVLKGQEKASRAILLAAAGRHNLMMLGSSGCGKTLAGKLISGIMPPLINEEISEVYMVQELSSTYSNNSPIPLVSDKRPFRYIHPGITTSKLLGNQKNEVGELLLANHGVLFADEICEYKREVIESLRIPLEEHLVRKYKDGKVYEHPTSFVFVAAGNPCKCGNLYELKKKCTCTLSERRRYLGKLSGPFLDRIDLFTEMRSIAASDMNKSIYRTDKRISEEYRYKVSSAWSIQRDRYREIGRNIYNGNLDSVDADLLCADRSVVEYASSIAEKEGFSGRGFIRIMKVARTIADLEDRKDLSKNDIAEAVVFRQRLSL